MQVALQGDIPNVIISDTFLGSLRGSDSDRGNPGSEIATSACGRLAMTGILFDKASCPFGVVIIDSDSLIIISRLRFARGAGSYGT